MDGGDGAPEDCLGVALDRPGVSAATTGDDDRAADGSSQVPAPEGSGQGATPKGSSQDRLITYL